MTKVEIRKAMHRIIENESQSTAMKIDMIFQLMGKLEPEYKPRQQVPEYDHDKIRRPGEKYNFTQSDRELAQKILRQMGLIT